jgi:phage-related protein
MRDLIWIADSREALSAFPLDIKRSFGFALRQVQNGLTPDIAKPLRGLGPGVYELKEDGPDRTFRVVYLLKLESGIYVIDAFVKKSKTGKGVPQEVARRIEGRIRAARNMDENA